MRKYQGKVKIFNGKPLNQEFSFYSQGTGAGVCFWLINGRGQMLAFNSMRAMSVYLKTQIKKEKAVI